MEKISEIEYIINYNELMEIIAQDYYVASSLKIALEEGLIIDSGRHIRVYMDSKNKKIDIFGDVLCKEAFGRKIYYFNDRGEVFPDQKHPDCFGYIIQDNGEPLHDLNLCRECKDLDLCCELCEKIQSGHERKELGLVTLEEMLAWKYQ